MTEVLVRNSRKTTDTFITDAILRGWLQDAHIWCAAYKKWPFTEGKASTTYVTTVTDELGNTIVNYPEGWKADSIRIMTIGGKQMKKMNFMSFLRMLENSSTGSTSRLTRRIYSDFSRQLYVNTGADVSGTLTVYGQYSPAIDPTDLTAVTVFSGYDEEGNEAIVEKMTAYLKRKEHLADEAELHDKRAQAILDQVYARVGDEQFGYQTGDNSMFDYVDVVRGRGGYNNNDIRKEDQFNG